MDNVPDKKKVAGFIKYPVIQGRCFERVTDYRCPLTNVCYLRRRKLMQWWAYAFPEAHWDFATGRRNLNFRNNINCVGKDHLKVFKISLIRIAWLKCKVLIAPLTSTLIQKPEQARKGRGTPPHCQSGKMQGGTCSVYCEWQSERLIADPRSGPSHTLFTCFSSPSSLSRVLWGKHSYL